MPSSLIGIDLDQPRLEGFRAFIRAWLYRHGDSTLLVDPGPLSTIPYLLGELRRHGVERLDTILLTHIHIDHAGGTGALLESYPQAKVLCHPDGIRHLVAPQKLWEGSRKVLGELAEIYGEIRPVPQESIFFDETVGETGGEVYLTPGHAPHHLCFRFGDLLFAGEVAGVSSAVSEGIYMRPATPPRFNLEVALASLDKVIALAPKRLALAHHGLVEPATTWLDIARQQFQLWVKGVASCADTAPDVREETTRQWLLQHDPHFALGAQLPADIAVRENYFLGNTLRGMFDYVDSLEPAARKQLATLTID
ncbi:MAG: MBL fold metallo-hydrolase [Desulfuromonas sp.]|nr:MAG: MBL fold metallo-hydrolase [Desulfuromonas sp.]